MSTRELDPKVLQHKEKGPSNITQEVEQAEQHHLANSEATLSKPVGLLCTHTMPKVRAEDDCKKPGCRSDIASGDPGVTDSQDDSRLREASGFRVPKLTRLVTLLCWWQCCPTFPPKSSKKIVSRVQMLPHALLQVSAMCLMHSMAPIILVIRACSVIQPCASEDQTPLMSVCHDVTNTHLHASPMHLTLGAPRASSEDSAGS